MKTVSLSHFESIESNPFTGQVDEVYTIERVPVPEDRTPIEVFNLKLVQSGNVYEIYEYDKPIVRGYKSKAKGGRNAKSDNVDSGKNRETALNRARKNLRRLINVNIRENSKFVTLTFRENITDLDYANNELKKFFKRLSYHMGFKASYSYVIEFQERGAVHYHVILFNVPYLAHKTLSELWGNGYVKINRIRDVDNVGAYVVKYMSKELSDERLKGRRCYGYSDNLDKPKEIVDANKIAHVLGTLEQSEKVTYQNTFSNEYYNINYTQIKVSRSK